MKSMVELRLKSAAVKAAVATAVATALQYNPLSYYFPR